MKVSVLMITYNQEHFIAQALESALMQRVDFDFEIVIGEDGSTDDTRKILLDYERRFPDKIRLLLHQKNIGMMPNFIETARACKGEYVAIIEGDDYWTSPYKLQKQVDFLDSHPEFSSCFHNVTILADGAETTCYKATNMKSVFYLKDVVTTNFIQTCSVMYRNGLEFPEWLQSMPMGDWPLHILNAQRGPIGYIDETMGTYRVHDSGVWSSMKKYDILQNSKRAALIIDSYLHHEYSGEMGKKIALWEVEMATILAREKRKADSIRHVMAAISRTPLYFKLYRRIIKKVIPALI